MGAIFHLGSTGLTEPTTPLERNCIACGSAIATRASICPVCKSWQSHWKNSLVFLGGSAGVLALLATAVTYIANTIYTAVSQRDDAQVLQFQYPGYQIFDNSGTVPILVSHLELFWQGGSTTVIVGQQLAPKQMYYKTDDLDKMRSTNPSASFVVNASGDGTALLPKASAFPYMDKCYSLVFFSMNTPEMAELNRFYAPGKVKIATAKLDAAFLFYYATNNAVLHWRQFPAVAAFLDLKKPGCHPSAAGEHG
jgi:hypothetical protein